MVCSYSTPSALPGEMYEQPASITRRIFDNVDVNQFIEIKEFEKTFRRRSGSPSASGVRDGGDAGPVGGPTAAMAVPPHRWSLLPAYLDPLSNATRTL